MGFAAYRPKKVHLKPPAASPAWIDKAAPESPAAAGTETSGTMKGVTGPAATNPSIVAWFH